MQTTCPECRTSFRITQTHLGLRRGLVRCGQCNAVFNAYDTLLPELEEPPIPTDALAEPHATETPPDFDSLSDLVPDNAPEWAPAASEQAEFGPETAPHGEPEPVSPHLSEPEPASPTPPADGSETMAETSESILLAELPSRIQAEKTGPPLWKTILFALLALLLLLALLSQVIYFFRADLATALPSVRPALNGLCQALGCEVPLPHQLTRRAITSSSLEHDPEQKSRARLTFLLTNRTGQTQAWPHLALTLSDVRDAPVAYKVFPPASYLSKDMDIHAGMAAETEREVTLDLDVGNLIPSGYSLSLVYP